MESWILKRGISLEVFERYAIRWDGNRFVIPVHDVEGKVLFNKYRRNPDSEEGPKYTYDTGAKVALYGVRDIPAAGKGVVICEGELDALVLISHGIAAVTSTGGAGSYSRELLEPLVGRSVYICLDNDEAGIKGACKIQQMLPEARIIWLPDRLGVGGDITDFFAMYSQGDFTRYALQAKTYPMPDPIIDGVTKKELRKRKVIYSTCIEHLMSIKRTGHFVRQCEVIIDIFVSANDQIKKRLAPVKAKISGTDIERAKSVPIDRFHTFNRAKKALCLWHKDSVPSMHYYEKDNKVHCFSCNNRGDAIDVAMKIHQVTMKEAIEILLKL